MKLYSNNNIFEINKSLNLYKDISPDNINNNLDKFTNTLNFENNNLNNISISILNPNKYINKDLNCNFYNYNNLSSNIKIIIIIILIILLIALVIKIIFHLIIIIEFSTKTK